MISRFIFRLSFPTSLPIIRRELEDAAMGSNTSNYRYDPIGNRRMAEEVYVQAALVSSYAANSLDQFTGITPDPSTIYHLAYDGNGNVTDLVGTNGSFVAKYQYDPYGNTIGKSGDLADVNHFRFSTKYTDSESGLVYYGFRFYVPEVGRWSGRDPIGEDGFECVRFNLNGRRTEIPKEFIVADNGYSFVLNNPSAKVDPFGLYDWNCATVDGQVNGTYNNNTYPIVNVSVFIGIATSNPNWPSGPGVMRITDAQGKFSTKVPCCVELTVFIEEPPPWYYKSGTIYGSPPPGNGQNISLFASGSYENSFEVNQLLSGQTDSVYFYVPLTQTSP